MNIVNEIDIYMHRSDSLTITLNEQCKISTYIHDPLHYL